MDSRNEKEQVQKRPKERKNKLRVVKLEDRVAPRISLNHNEALVREPAKGASKAPEARGEKKPKVRVVKLEDRVVPRIIGNHNESLVRESAKGARMAPEARRGKWR
jgi:hypothetical protein